MNLTLLRLELKSTLKQTQTRTRTDVQCLVDTQFDLLTNLVHTVKTNLLFSTLSFLSTICEYQFKIFDMNNILRKLKSHLLTKSRIYISASKYVK